MATINDLATSDLLNEGWAVTGAGVTKAYQALSALADDTKYVKCPASKGRLRISFYDEDSIALPAGAVIQSVSIYVRAAKTDAVARTLTVQVMSSQDTSKYTSRTISVNQTPPSGTSTVLVGTYNKDALGKAWTIDRVFRLQAQVFTYSGTSADKVRVYEFYAVVNYKARPTVKVINPTGTQNTPSPLVQFTYAQDEGDRQTSFAWKIFTAAQQEDRTFNPDKTTPYKNLGSTVQGDITQFFLNPIAAGTYYVYVQALSAAGAHSAWVGRAFTCRAALPGAPGGSYGGVGTGGGGGFESVIGDGVTSNAFATVRDGSNLLSLQQSDFESPTDSLGFSGTNAAVDADFTHGYGDGTSSLSVICATNAPCSITGQYVGVDENAHITVRAQFLAVVNPSSITVTCRFYDATFTEIGSSALTDTITDSATTWMESVISGVTPGGAVYLRLTMDFANTVTADQHNVDDIGVMYGVNAAWSNGGHASRNLLSSFVSDANSPEGLVAPWETATVASTYDRVATPLGTGDDPDYAFRLTYNGVTPTISYISTGTAYTDNTFSTGYTLNKPASGADGDLLVAYVSSSVGGRPTPPAGWTIVDHINAASPNELGLTVMILDALAADPSTWVGDFENVTACKRATVVRYRGAAAVADQFDASQVGQWGPGVNITTASVTNANAGAWRLSAFAIEDDAAGGSAIANIIAPTVPEIEFVGTATPWILNSTTTTSTTTFTINKPQGGVIAGDLLIAGLSISGNVGTVTAPSGWTLVRKTTKTIGNGDRYSGTTTFAVFKRTAGASEPNTWTGSHSSGFAPKLTQAVAYRNCANASLQFIAENAATGTSQTMTTPAVTNNDSNAWRISMFAASSASGTLTDASNEGAVRADNHTSLYGNNDVSLMVAGSGAPVSSGTQQRNAHATAPVASVVAWIGIIKPLATPPAPGTAESERQDATAGVAAFPWITLAVYDSNGVADQGAQSVTAQFTPGSGTTAYQSATWIGFLKPIAPTIEGDMGANAFHTVDVSAVDQAVWDRAGGKMAVLGSFLGSTAGTPYLKLYCYVGTHYLGSQTARGVAYNDTVWMPSSAVFDILPGTTRVKIGHFTTDRQIGDVMYFDRMSVGFGEGTTFRPGTERDAHPVFDIPLVEYAEDFGTGYSDWAPLPGQESQLLKYDQLTGLCTFVDQTIVPLSSRKYRARTESFGLRGDTFISDYGPESDEVQLLAEEWWLKDLVDPTMSMQLKVSLDPLKVTTTNADATFQPLGRNRPIVVTEGYKGDVIPIQIQVDRIDYAKLKRVFNSGHALYLQSNMDNAWWVRPVGDLPSETQLTGKLRTDPLRFVNVTFQEVDPEL